MPLKSTVLVKTPLGAEELDAATDGQLEELIMIALQPMHPNASQLAGIPRKLLGAIAAELRGRREEARAENPRVRHEHFVLEIGSTDKTHGGDAED
jgi:hypothetical protein